MRINHNIAALNTYRQLSMGSAATQRNMEKLSSGLRINRGADDAAGLTVSEKMRSQIRGLDQAFRNAQDGISMIQTADGALSTVNDILVRVRELATQAANGTYDKGDDLARIQEEVKQLSAQITNIKDDTKFNNINLLNGAGDTNGAASGFITLQIGVAKDQTLGLDVSEFDLSTVASGVSGYDLSSQSGAQAALSGIEAKINEVSAMRSYLGANQNSLEYTINDLNTTSENLTAAESRIRDVDMAKEMMEFTKNNIINQAAQAMLAQANQQPQQVLQLLR